jgi:antitoxin PrlF
MTALQRLEPVDCYVIVILSTRDCEWQAIFHLAGLSLVAASPRCAIAFASVPYYTLHRKDKETVMPTDATLTSKGQTTIPKEIRDGLGMKPGDRMTFTLMPDATVVMRVKTKSVTELAGLLHKKGRKAIPVEQLST